MSSKLVDMELDEISLVKKGANQFSTVSIAKSLSGEEEEMEELFFEDGSPADVDDLELGDVVFTEDGEALEVVEDEDGDEEEIGKSSNALVLARAARPTIRNTFHNSAKNRMNAFGERSARNAKKFKTKVMNNGGRKVADATKPARDSMRTTGNSFAAGLGARGAGSASKKALATENRMLGGSGAAFHVGSNAAKYGAGAGVGIAGTGAGVYEYNRRKNVAKSLREEFGKALTDEDRDDVISKAFDEIESLQYAATEAMEIAKSEQQARVYSEYVAIAKTYTLPFEDEDVAMAMMEAEANLSEEACAIIAKSFELASNLIDNEIGFEGVGYDSPTMASIEDTLQEFGKSGDPDSVVALMEANPGMYDAYLAEQRG